MDVRKVQIALAKIKPGLEKYIDIMSKLNKVNVAQDKLFQRSFNGFYRIRQRTPEFYKVYYSYLEASKSSVPSFEDTIKHIYRQLGRVEASFSSKLVATLDPVLPIWDTYVLKNLGLLAPSMTCKDRINKIINLYTKIISWYSDYIKSDEGKLIVELFNKHYSGVNISKTKKIDFVLWQMRD